MSKKEKIVEQIFPMGFDKLEKLIENRDKLTFEETEKLNEMLRDVSTKFEGFEVETKMCHYCKKQGLEKDFVKDDSLWKADSNYRRKGNMETQCILMEIGNISNLI